MIATFYEVWNDRHGDLNKREDVFIRLCLLLMEALALHYFLHKPLIDSFILSASFFFLVFDYYVTWVLIKNKVLEPRRGTTYTWWTYTAKKGWFDNIPLWKNASPWVKFGLKASVFIASLIIFIW